MILLEKFFKRAGMVLIEIQHVETKGGSLRGMVQLAGGPHRANREAIDRLIAAEREAAFDRSEVYRAFAARVDEVPQDLHQRVAQAKAQG